MKAELTTTLVNRELELDSQKHLNLARRFIQRADCGKTALTSLPPENRRSKRLRVAEQRIGVIEVRVIQEIEGIRAKAQPAGFTKPSYTE